MPDKNARLFVKSYFAGSIEAAMEEAHAELGPDALLLHSREAPPEARPKGAYEVVFGCRPASQGSSAAAPETVSDPVGDLRKRMEEIREMVSRLAPARDGAMGGSVSDILLKAGVDPVLAVDIEMTVHHRLRNQSVLQMGRLKQGGWDPAAIQRETIAELESRLVVAPEVGRITALVGPPGTGKTTCLIKLAVTQGLAKRRPVRLISTDNFRIAAAAQLQTYAEILGVPFTLAETTTALGLAIDAAPPPEALVLIDTPGYSPASEEASADLAYFLRSRQDIDTHLVLTASTSVADLRAAADRFTCFRPAKLLFSRLDEIGSSGAMFSEAVRSGKPLSFFSTGQIVPEDLEPARAERVARLLVPELPQPCEAVA